MSGFAFTKIVRDVGKVFQHRDGFVWDVHVGIVVVFNLADKGMLKVCRICVVLRGM
jgi:hypothetical protein